MVGEVGFTEDGQPRHIGHEVVFHPQATHGVVGGGVDHHGRFMGVVVRDFFVHVKQIAVLDVYKRQEQITSLFVRKFPDDAVGHREAGEQAASRQVAVGLSLIHIFLFKSFF